MRLIDPDVFEYYKRATSGKENHMKLKNNIYLLSQSNTPCIVAGGYKFPIRETIIETCSCRTDILDEIVPDDVIARVRISNVGYPETTSTQSTSTTYTYTNNRQQIDIEKTKYYQLGNGVLVPKKVIFNPPATIVIWEDGKKTIVKCMEGDDYDAEKGLALCFMKKACESGYSKELKRAKDWEKERSEALENVIVEEHPAQKSLYLAAEAVKRRLLGGVGNLLNSPNKKPCEEAKEDGPDKV